MEKQERLLAFELLLLENKVINITPRTSRHVLGQLKRRPDRIGAQAKAELARRDRLKPPKKTEMYGALKDALVRRNIGKKHMERMIPHYKKGNVKSMARAIRQAAEEIKKKRDKAVLVRKAAKKAVEAERARIAKVAAKTAAKTAKAKSKVKSKVKTKPKIKSSKNITKPKTKAANTIKAKGNAKQATVAKKKPKLVVKTPSVKAKKTMKPKPPVLQKASDAIATLIPPKEAPAPTAKAHVPHKQPELPSLSTVKQPYKPQPQPTIPRHPPPEPEVVMKARNRVIIDKTGQEYSDATHYISADGLARPWEAYHDSMKKWEGGGMRDFEVPSGQYKDDPRLVSPEPWMPQDIKHAYELKKKKWQKKIPQAWGGTKKPKKGWFGT